MSLLRHLARAGTAPVRARPSPPPAQPVPLLGGAADAPPAVDVDVPVRRPTIITRDEARPPTEQLPRAHDAGTRARVAAAADVTPRTPDEGVPILPDDATVPARPREPASHQVRVDASPAPAPAAPPRAAPPAPPSPGGRPPGRRDGPTIVPVEPARRTAAPMPRTPVTEPAEPAPPATLDAPAPVAERAVTERVVTERSVVTPRPDGRTEPTDRVRGTGDGGRSTVPSSAPSARPTDPSPVEVRIGTIEIHEAPEPATARAPSPRGFADLAAVRAYDWGRDG